MNHILCIIFVLLIVILMITKLKLKQNFVSNSNNNKLTIVTSYFKVNRTRKLDYTNGRTNMPKDSDGIYKEWMKGLLSYQGPMIIYTDNETYNYIKKLRKNFKETKIIKMEISELPTYNFFKNNKNNNNKYTTMIWKEHADKDINKKLYTIWSSKLPLLETSVNDNPFNTFYFAWFDIGYIRDKDKILGVDWPCKDKLKILNNKVVFNIVYGGPTCKEGGSTTGGFIGCNINNISNISKLYVNKIKQRIKNSTLNGNDQPIYNEIRCEQPHLIKGIKGVKSKYWTDVLHNEWFYAIPYFFDRKYKY